MKVPPPHLTGRVKSSAQDWGIQYPPPNPAGRDSMLEQTTSEETLEKAVPMKDLAAKATPELR